MDLARAKELAPQVEGAFGHLVAGYVEGNPDADASSGLGDEALTELDLGVEAKVVLEIAAAYVAGNYEYTGEAIEIMRKIEAGEI